MGKKVRSGERRKKEERTQVKTMVYRVACGARKACSARKACGARNTGVPKYGNIYEKIITHYDCTEYKLVLMYAESLLKKVKILETEVEFEIIENKSLRKKLES